jgi:hypothetical protein
MRAHVFGEFKHRGRVLTAEDGLQLVVCVDIALVLFVLEIVLLDVIPDLLGDRAAGLRGVTNNGGQDGVRLHRFHEGGVCFTGSCFFGHRTDMLAVSRRRVNSSSQGFLLSGEESSLEARGRFAD